MAELETLCISDLPDRGGRGFFKKTLRPVSVPLKCLFSEAEYNNIHIFHTYHCGSAMNSHGFTPNEKASFVFCVVCQAPEPRTEKMQVDQDWTAVYPAATPFRPGSVPLPVRMGYPVKGGVPPGKKGNLELIKVRPQYLHETTVLGYIFSTVVGLFSHGSKD